MRFSENIFSAKTSHILPASSVGMSSARSDGRLARVLLLKTMSASVSPQTKV